MKGFYEQRNEFFGLGLREALWILPAEWLKIGEVPSEFSHLCENFPERAAELQEALDGRLLDNVMAVCRHANDEPLGFIIEYKGGGKMQTRKAFKRSETIMPATEVPEVIWNNIRRRNPRRFDEMKREMELRPNAVAFGFDEHLQPIACYVHF